MQQTDTTSVEPTTEDTVKYVIKRDGKRQPVNVDKIRARFSNKVYGLNMDYINLEIIVQKVVSGIYQGKISLFPSTAAISPSPSKMRYLPQRLRKWAPRVGSRAGAEGAHQDSSVRFSNLYTI